LIPGLTHLDRKNTPSFSARLCKGDLDDGRSPRTYPLNQQFLEFTGTTSLSDSALHAPAAGGGRDNLKTIF
jgi:hypothetical protein